MSLQTTRGKPRQAGIPIEVPDKLLLVLRVMGELSLRLEVAGYHLTGRFNATHRAEATSVSTAQRNPGHGHPSSRPLPAVHTLRT